jgi:putative hydrolase of the HAD superfamily
MIPNPEAISALVFDLGNVLIEIDFMRCVHHWSTCTNIPPDQIVDRFRVDRHYADFERGRMPAQAYFEILRRQLGLGLSDQQMTIGWNRIIGEEKPNSKASVLALKPHFPLYVLTNTNPVHKREWAIRHKGLLQHFAHLFVSSDMGCRKPEADVYQMVVATIGLPADQILFLDDSPENVTGAAAAGLTAYQVCRDEDIPSLAAELLDGRADTINFSPTGEV